MTERKHTELPWRVGPVGGIYPAEPGSPGIGSTKHRTGGYCENGEENEKFIVHACNNHYALIEALEGLLNTEWAVTPDWGPDKWEEATDKARATLKQAKGESE